MRYFKILIYVLLLSGLIVSCTEPIEIKLDDSYARLIVEGSVTTDRISHKVILSRTSDYFYNQPPLMVTGAKVSISDNGNPIELEEVSPGNYHTVPAFRGVPGHTYILDVVLSEPIGGYSEYSASSTMNYVSRVDSIGLLYHSDWGEEGVWEVKCFVLDPPTADYYRFMISRNFKLVTDTLSEWFVIDDKFFNGNYIAGASIGFLGQDSPDERLVAGDTVIAEINSIGKDYASFIQEAQSELFGSNPLFSGPPANVKGNISNGAFGFFSAYSITRGYAITPEFK
jgi:hypothetical protein